MQNSMVYNVGDMKYHRICNGCPVQDYSKHGERCNEDISEFYSVGAAHAAGWTHDEDAEWICPSCANKSTK